MLIRSRRPSDCHESEVTPESVFLNRRQFIQAGVAAAGVAVASGVAAEEEPYGKDLPVASKKNHAEGDDVTDWESATSHNNFYELGYNKKSPKKHAHWLTLDPWNIVVDGECEQPGELSLEDFMKPHPLEERIYRFRCVEAWSMVVPWVGFSLADVLKRFKPTSKAKYVAFQTIHDPQKLIPQLSPLLDWPYKEGLRIDEAMHPLTFMTVGMYGKVLPAQNGAPIRLIVPWKYGFKSIKSIVRISFVEEQPPTAWETKNPEEYGFYANVNPNVDHPRWSQARERRLGELFKRDTPMFNGYDEVAPLYAGMDLNKFY